MARACAGDEHHPRTRTWIARGAIRRILDADDHFRDLSDRPVEGQSDGLDVERDEPALRLGGIPVFCREESIGLPKELDARLDQVAAKDFDTHFSDAFRIAPRRSISTTHALQMLRRG